MTHGDRVKLSRTQPAPSPGIVHLGLGAFFRAHAAVYLQADIARSGGDWGVIGVSLRSPKVRDSLEKQDFVYSAVEISERGLKSQVIEVLCDVLVAPENPLTVIEAMAAVSTKLVSLTITEKGYCLGANGKLDMAHADIVHDLYSPLPCTAVGYLARALQLRFRNRQRPFTVLSLDNLPGNGALVRNAVLAFAQKLDPKLADWIDGEGCFPSTMVDRIVPAMTAKVISRIENEIGISDLAPVQHEPFRQWVIEDQFVDNLRPNLTAVGAELVQDVTPFENMKLRMLNGTHSALAYIGFLAGHKAVANAAQDKRISSFIKTMWQEEIIPSLTPPENTNLEAYAASLMDRYRNPAIRHLLIQIAMDGSQKLPQRILAPLFENLAAGRPYKHFVAVLVAWIGFLQTQQEDIDDPLARALADAVSRPTRDVVPQILAIDVIFGRHPVELIEDELKAGLESYAMHGITSLFQRGGS